MYICTMYYIYAYTCSLGLISLSLASSFENRQKRKEKKSKIHNFQLSRLSLTSTAYKIIPLPCARAPHAHRIPSFICVRSTYLVRGTRYDVHRQVALLATTTCILCTSTSYGRSTATYVQGTSYYCGTTSPQYSYIVRCTM